MSDLKSIFDVSALSHGFDKGLVLNQETTSYFLLMVAAMSAAKLFNKLCFKKAGNGGTNGDNEDERKGKDPKHGNICSKMLKMIVPGKEKSEGERSRRESSGSNHKGMLDGLFGKEHDHEKEHKKDEETTDDERSHDNEHKDTKHDEVKREDVEVHISNADASGSREHAATVKNRKGKKKSKKFC